MFLLVLSLGACEGGSGSKALELRGATMGTSYTITLAAAPADSDLDALRADIDQRLDALNRVLSTYDPDSALSRFNARRDAAWHAVPEELISVVEVARSVGSDTGGALDVTIGPAVDLWGFGPPERGSTRPPAADVEAVRARIGLAHLEHRVQPPALRKRLPDLQVDLSAVAKGFAVDALASLLTARGFEHFIVEIGGELATRGRNPDGAAWRIAVESPEAGESRVHRVLSVSGLAIATSGRHRNAFTDSGRRYSHIIDPRTAAPVEHELLSVTVVHESAAMADALATALLVLGPADALRHAERDGYCVLLLTGRPGAIEESTTRCMRVLFSETAPD